jgi:hypothetical protein
MAFGNAGSSTSLAAAGISGFSPHHRRRGGRTAHGPHHASWNNPEQNIEAIRGAEEAGAKFVLLSYPPNYPESEQDIYDYIKAQCDATSLAVMLFPMFLCGSRAASTPRAFLLL